MGICLRPVFDWVETGVRRRSDGSILILSRRLEWRQLRRRAMRINLFFPRLKTFSGAEHLLIEVSRLLALRGHRVTIITRGVSEHCVDHLPDDVSVVSHEVGKRLTGFHLLDSLADVLAAARLGELGPECDLACFIADPVLPALPRWKRRWPETPAVYWCLQPPRFAYDLMWETVRAHRPLGYFIPPLASIYRRLDRHLARRADLLLTLSRDYAEWCAELYGLENVDRVAAGVDPEIGTTADGRRARARLGLDEETPLVLTVNKLIARKNVDVFLRAMTRVLERIPAARGVVVGSGPLERPLKKLHHELGLGDRVYFTGHVPDFADVADLFAAADVYVFLEKNVPFGLTVLEAAICGTPAVAVDGGGVCETLIDGRTGRIVSDHRDWRQVADRVCELLVDGEARDVMGRQARAHAGEFSWEATAVSLERRFEQVLATHTPASSTSTS